MTSGSLPTFLDVLTNFDVKSLAMDSWPYQMRRANKTLVFYGDDTWLKMLDSSIFARSEGTNSLFVWDTVEVDNNVTRHLDGELQKSDWDVLILHYLGLDHIASLQPPSSSSSSSNTLGSLGGSFQFQDAAQTNGNGRNHKEALHGSNFEPRRQEKSVLDPG